MARVGRRIEQLVDGARPLVAPRVGEKGAHRVGVGNGARQIKRHAAQEGRVVGERPRDEVLLSPRGRVKEDPRRSPSARASAPPAPE